MPGSSNSNTPREPTLAALFGAAVAHHQRGALAEAERGYRHILTLFPDHAETHGRLAAVLLTHGKTADAIAHLERAGALRPNLFEVQANLGQAYLAAGQFMPALEALSRALALRDTPPLRALFAQCVKQVRFTPERSGRFRDLARRALSEGWAPPRELTGACVGLIKLSPVVNDAIARANAAWPARLAAADLLGATGFAELTGDLLLRALLESDPIPDVGLERLLTNLRHATLMDGAADDALGDGRLPFYAALARQCFINEFVFSLTDSEAEAAQRLRASLEHALASGALCPASWPIIVGTYFPLHDVANAHALLERPWPPPIAALLDQQIRQPAQERQIAASMPALTGVDDAVSRAVRQQYEESPYPRWVAAGPPIAPAAALDPRMAQRFDALIAGCGTGMSTIEFARQAPGARILAIDLSIASLSYAKCMAQKFGLAGIEFAQADIMALGDIGRSFDVIDCSGVLHHMADPWAGWRVLLSLLRPGGLMQVALYSELARRNVVAARALIAARGYRPVVEDIRRCREEVMAGDADPLLQSLTKSSDFFTMSECRDLLFHVQEHRVTLPQIKAFLTESRMQFAGFHLDAATWRNFAARFPDPAAATDLDRWHAFETEAPTTFAAMYQFRIRKPAAAR